MPCLVFLCVPLMPSLLPAFQAKLPNFQFPVHLYTEYLTLLSGWRRKWLLSYCRALTTRSRGTVFWQPGCAHTKMTLSSPMRTSYSSCQVRSRLFVWFGFQVASDPGSKWNPAALSNRGRYIFFSLRWVPIVFWHLRSTVLVNFGLCDSDKELGCVFDLFHRS